MEGETHKTCTSCNESKPRELFVGKAKNTRSKIGAKCRECHNQVQRTAWRKRREAETAEQREQRIVSGRERWLTKKYDLSIAAYHVLLELQDSACAICAAPLAEGRKYFDVDHDHQSGAVRGLLCKECNMALGLFKDDPGRLRSAAVYLEERR